MQALFTLFAGSFRLVTMFLTLFVFGIGWPITLVYILWRALHDLRRIANALDGGAKTQELPPNTVQVLPPLPENPRPVRMALSAFGR
jgi:hypothetical protein